MGMSDEVLATDPASGHDPGSWLLFNDVFQSLLSFPKGSTTPRPEAAERCSFKDGTSRVYSCTLRDGLAFSKGWVPDYPDPDNFVAPFFGAGNVLSNHYTSPRLTAQLIPATAEQPSREAAVGDFQRIQDIIADQVPMLPLWQGKQYAVAQDDITGLQWTLDSSTVFRLWEIGKTSGG
ncbi:hypothetical protein VT50_0232520 [Streptomyces antioxidans]|uniref:Solute-binding protein family 5 domain-containing protein n=1 Tax=Streptomyces antioxidans TaxID=1507734 RepID=A0A1V4CW09_9ACTN|nr:hypothetical protein VT50_0232520 [Streptomyces antioxidans]